MFIKIWIVNVINCYHVLLIIIWIVNAEVIIANVLTSVSAKLLAQRFDLSYLVYVRDVTEVVILIDYHEIFGLNVVWNHSWAYLDTEKDMATMRKCTGDEKNGRIEWCVAVEMCVQHLKQIEKIRAINFVTTKQCIRDWNSLIL